MAKARPVPSPSVSQKALVDQLIAERAREAKLAKWAGGTPSHHRTWVQVIYTPTGGQPTRSRS